MDLKKLKKEELLKLKGDIESQISFIDSIKTEIQTSKDKTKLSGLKKGDKIFCICFNGSKIYNMDYVKIHFYENEKDNAWTNYSTEHDTKPMGCSSAIKTDSMNNHYFLNEISSHFYFFTLKPENWKNDLKLALDDNIKSRKNYFNQGINKLKNKIKSLITSKEVDELIEKCV